MATQSDIEYHYDVANDFYKVFLDRDYRAYSCGVWKSAQTLEEAQAAKLDRLCHYARVSSGDHVLDVGCGWGGLMRHAISQFGSASAHGLTLSTDQYDYVRANAGPSVSVELCSWADFDSHSKPYDAIISVGAFEHFASREDRRLQRHRDVYRDFFSWCQRVSTIDAYVGLQTIITSRMPANVTEIRDTRYLLERVFPGSALPCVSDIQAATLDLYEISSAKRIGSDYARTLEHWDKRLLANRETIVSDYSAELFDHYHTYFQSAIRSFRSGVIDLLQVSLKRVAAGRNLRRRTNV
ncbi:MAG TPA: cyclopropane-fatty-acyl-phospholipid synthase family protein [Gammaproteobacteria bacterium]